MNTPRTPGQAVIGLQTERAMFWIPCLFLLQILKRSQTTNGNEFEKSSIDLSDLVLK